MSLAPLNRLAGFCSVQVRVPLTSVTRAMAAPLSAISIRSSFIMDDVQECRATSSRQRTGSPFRYPHRQRRHGSRHRQSRRAGRGDRLHQRLASAALRDGAAHGREADSRRVRVGRAHRFDKARDAWKKSNARVLFGVHAETSTGVRQDLAALREIATPHRRSGRLPIVDAVTSPGAHPSGSIATGSTSATRHAKALSCRPLTGDVQRPRGRASRRTYPVIGLDKSADVLGPGVIAAARTITRRQFR